MSIEVLQAWFRGARLHPTLVAEHGSVLHVVLVLEA